MFHTNFRQFRTGTCVKSATPKSFRIFGCEERTTLSTRLDTPADMFVGSVSLDSIFALPCHRERAAQREFYHQYSYPTQEPANLIHSLSGWCSIALSGFRSVDPIDKTLHKCIFAHAVYVWLCWLNCACSGEPDQYNGASARVLCVLSCARRLFDTHDGEKLAAIRRV